MESDAYRYWEVAAELARGLHDDHDPLQTMTVGARLAVELVPGCDAATVTRRQASALSTAAATTDRARQVDELQYELDQGPCRDAVLVGETVESRSVAEDHRWRAWGPQAAELGITSVMSLPLAAAGRGFGALNLYADHTSVHDRYVRAVAALIATQLGVAVAAATEIGQLTAGLASRTVIGQAQGIVMERYGLSAEQAFALLVRRSQDRNTKLRRIAADLVVTGELPESVRRPPLRRTALEDRRE